MQNISIIPNHSGIYSITNTINSKRYIGYAKNIRKRLHEHRAQLRNKKHDNERLQKSWNKHREDIFLFEIIEQCDIEQLCSQENWWCNMLDVHNDKYGYNIGSTNPNRHSSPSRVTIEKIKEVWKHKSHPSKGKPLSEETKRKVSEANILYYKTHPSCHTGTKISEERKQRLREINTGRIHTVSAREKMSNSHKGEKRNPEEVKRRVETYKENRKNKRIAKGKPKRIKREVKIYKCNIDGSIVQEYKSLVEAARENNCDHSTIGYACTGKIKIAKGYKWKREIIEIYEK